MVGTEDHAFNLKHDLRKQTQPSKTNQMSKTATNKQMSQTTRQPASATPDPTRSTPKATAQPQAKTDKTTEQQTKGITIIGILPP
ncbi:hypothetical protein AVEN_259771-1 [Araneus ventricosus]|uniref:Uncharacterized protein n=1 Tax=Araneus ventricosus TaxID=182803 RepID=A0A4Y1ZUS2_ARAVE|nr:hypothetical protein AVEN_259771-1 [Araneus ventricosus]